MKPIATLNLKTLTLDIGTEQFVVDNYMGLYYLPFEGVDESYKWHASELNSKEYDRTYREIVAYVQSLGFTEAPFSYKEFLNICERLFEMYSILRKL